MPTPEQMAASLERATGRSLSEWTAALDAALPGAPYREREAWLMGEHGLGRGHARAIIHLGEHLGRGTEEDLIAAQYAGSKAPLRPVYEALEAAVRTLGDDVAVEPRKTYVTFSRRRQFALAQASTRDRVDLGLRLDAPAPGTGARLEEAGSFGSGNITHRVALRAPAEVDDEVRAWLEQAYAGAA